MSKSKLLSLAFLLSLFLPAWALAATDIVIGTQPVSQAIAPAANATFTVAATGTATLTYQWKKDGATLADAAGHISGATTASLTITAAVSTDAGSYTVDVTNGLGTVTSSAATLSLLSPATAGAATGATTGGFTANWSAVTGATGYQIDVSTSRAFSNTPPAIPNTFVTGYQGRDVGNTLSVAVTGLKENTTYFYRIRPYNADAVGASSTLSNVVVARTSASPSSSPTGIVILNETFPNATANPVSDVNAGLTATGDANSYLIPSATQAVWYAGGTANINYLQNTLFSVSAGASRGYLAYFEPSTSVASLAVGETLTATIRLKYTEGSAVSGAGDFRVALLNSNANGQNYNVAESTNAMNPARITAQSFSLTASAAARGYSGYVVESTASQTAPATDSISFWLRSPATVPNTGVSPTTGQGTGQWVGPTITSSPGTLATLVQPHSTFTPVGSSGGGTVGAMSNDGSDYLVTLSVKHVSATQVDLAYVVKSGGSVVQSHAVSQTSGSLVTAFDSLLLFSNFNAVPTILGFTVAKLPALPTITTQPANQTVYAGASASFSVIGDSTDTLTYQWQKKASGGSFTDVSGATAATLSLTNVQAADAADYRVIVSNRGGSVTSSAATLTVVLAPSAPVATAASSVTTSGFTANWGSAAGATGYRLDVSTDSGFGSFVNGYQNLDVGAALTLAVTGLSDYTTYYYRVRAVNPAGPSVSSNTITAVTLATPLSITTQPADLSVVAGDDAIFTVAATSTTTLSYQWQMKPPGGSFANLPGATAASLTVTSAQLGDSGNVYQVVVTNAAGSVTSGSATLTVSAAALPPSITTQPQAQSVKAGDTATFTVAATGTAPLAYQWSKDLSPLPGATSTTLTLTNVQPSDAGSYTVTVTNVADSVTSNAAVLTVRVPPGAPAAAPATLVTTTRFNANWAAVTGATGYRLDVATDAGFTSFVSGYQDLDAGAVLTRAVTGLTADTTYYYRIRAYNADDTGAFSDTIPVATLAAPAGETILHDTISAATLHAGLVADANNVLAPTSTQAVWASFDSDGIAYEAGTSLGLSAGAGRGLMAYFEPSTSLAALEVGEALSATVTFTMTGGTPTTLPGNFRVGLFNSGGHGTASNGTRSDTTAIPARYAPGLSNSLTDAPTGDTARGYSGYIVEAKAATTVSTDSLSFWFRTAATASSGDGTEIVGPADADLASVVPSTTFSRIGATGGGTVGAIANDTTVYTLNFTVRHVSATQVDLAYTVKTGATTVMSYASSQTSDSPVLSFDSLMLFSGYGPAFSVLDLHLTRILAGPVIVTPPADKSVVVGDTVSLSVVAGGSAPFSYQWRKNGSPLTDVDGQIAGAATAVLTLTGVQLADAGDYTVVVTNAIDSVSSAAAALTVSAPPAITSPPQAATVAFGGSTSLTVSVSGTAPFTYQWSKDGSPIDGATDSTLVLSNVVGSSAGSYTVTVTNAVDSVTSAAAVVTVTPAIVTQPKSQTALTGSIVTFSVVARGTGPFTYQWRQAGVAIEGATGPTLTLTGLEAADAGNYSVVVTDGGGSITSNTAVLGVNAGTTTLPTQPTIPAVVYNILDYLPQGSSLPEGRQVAAAPPTDYTDIIQAAIDDASAHGGGIVQIPAATDPYLSGPLTLRDKINLQIDGGATLRALPYGTYPSGGTALVSAPSGATDVAITGAGTIEGDGTAWWTAYNADNSLSRPRLIQFTRATNILVSGITLQNSPQFHLAFSNANTNVTVTGVTITAPADSPNTDGIDPAGTNFLIQNCSISVGDDNIAIKPGSAVCGAMTVAYCTFGTGHGLSVGGQTNAGLDGLTVAHCTFTGTTSGIRLKADATQGGLVKNVAYSDLTMTNVAYPIVFYSYYNETGTPGTTSNSNQITPDKVLARNAADLGGSAIPKWQGITIDGLAATGATGYSIIWGLPLADALISDVTLNNVSITGAHGLKVYNAANVRFTGTTAFAELITCNALLITAQPQAQSVNSTGTASFSVTAAGTSGVTGTAPSYRWNLNGSPLTDGVQPDGSILSGVTGSTLTLTGARGASAGSYSCTVSNSLDGRATAAGAFAAGSLAVSGTSSAAALLVTYPDPENVPTIPTITQALADQEANEGTTVTFTVAGSSSYAITGYQWKKDGVLLTDGGIVSGSGTATLTLTGVSAADAGLYTALVWNEAGSAASAAHLVVKTAPVITQQPTAPSGPVTPGESVSFTVVATSEEAMTYQWLKDGAALANASGHIAGVATDTLTLTGVQTADAGSYTVKVSNAVGYVVSDAAVLTVRTVPPAPVANAASEITTVRFLASWNAAATATGYRLDVSTSSDFSSFLPGYQNFDAGSALSKLVTALAPAQTYYYRVRATNDLGASDNSATIAVTTLPVRLAPAITSPAGTTFTIGLACSFTVTATGEPAPTFTATGLPSWAALDAATGVLSGTPPTGLDGAQIPLVITAQNGVAPAASQAFTLAVKTAPAVSTPMTITTFAGEVGAIGNADGTGSAAHFNHPSGVAVDAAGNVYLTDTDNHTVRRITSAGVVTTIAGAAGTSGYANATGTSAMFNSPSGLAAVATGSAVDLYVADTLNEVIRSVNSGFSVGKKAGQPNTPGSADGGTDAAQFSGPQGLAADDTYLYLADTNNHTIRRISIASGDTTTFAGLAGHPGSADGVGTAARFNAPSGVAVDQAGNLYVADTDNNTIRVITSGGEVRTLAGLAGSSGAADGTGTAARFNHPSALVVDSAYNVYVLDTDNQTIRKIASAAGTVTTVAGQAGAAGSADGDGDAARFSGPVGLAQASTGEFYIADTNNHTIRKGVFPGAPAITRQPQSLAVTAGATAQFSVTATGTPSPTYQWMHDGAAVSGATNATLSLANVQTSDAGSYTVVVTNSQGSVTSETATLTVSAPTASGGVSGGGGAPGLWFHLSLALLVAARWIGRRRTA